MSRHKEVKCPPTLPINFLVGNTASQEGVAKVINGTETNRLFRNGVASVCGATKVCPGPFPATVPFTILGFYNPDPKCEQCITVTTTNLSADGTLFTHAHANSYNPNDVCENYLGDPGLSAARGVAQSYQVVLPKGTRKFVVVVEGVAAGQAPAFGTLTLSGFNCQGVRPILVAAVAAKAGPGNDLK